ncbi:MAG TPA: Hpt domain-containing protein, partial [Pirellulales bacterium]|nr:Hpt domain-containing protein [Pirellulales bacterium]
DRRLFEDLVGFFVEDYPALLTQLRQGLDTGDAMLATRSAHSLKGLCSSFDAHSVVVLAARLEKLGSEGDLETARKCVGPLEGELTRLASALAAYRPATS